MHLMSKNKGETEDRQANRRLSRSNVSGSRRLSFGKFFLEGRTARLPVMSSGVAYVNDPLPCDSLISQ